MSKRCAALKRGAFLLILALFLPHTVWAETEHFRGHFDFYWGGIPIGKIVLSYSEGEGSYRVDSYARTRGVVKLISEHKSNVFVTGRRDASGYYPQHFHSVYEDEDTKKLIEMRYDGQGVLKEHRLVPQRKESRPEVEADLTQGAYDILSAVLMMRHRLAGAVACEERAEESCSSSLTVPIFDGKRRFDLHAELLPEKAEFYSAGKKQWAHVLKLQRLPLAGYTDKELRKLEDATHPVYFYVAVEELTPLGLEVEAKGLPLVARLEAP